MRRTRSSVPRKPPLAVADVGPIVCLAAPKRVPAGTRIVVTAHYDNSKRNPFNPDPTAAVRWGDPTTDEMMIGGLDFIAAGSATNE